MDYIASQKTIKCGSNSFAGGSGAKATANVSFAFGEGSEANRDNSVALMGGKTDANTQFAVGNLLTIDNGGNVYTNGDVIATVGGNVHKLSEKISDYYTKAEIDSKISSVYKYKGSVLNPLLLPDSDQTQGEVYNCIIGGGLSKLYKQSTISIKSVSHNESKYTITVNFGSTVSSDIYDGGNTKPDTVYLNSNMASGYVYGKVTATTGTSITVDYSAYVEAMKKQDSGGTDPVYQFVNFNAGFPFDTSTFIVTKGTTSDPIQYINTGVNVAWNGSAWDSLGTTIDLSDYPTKAEVQKMIQEAIGG